MENSQILGDSALDFTRKRQQEIAEIEEEIAWVKEQDEPYLGGYESVIIERILSRLIAQRDELKRGMKA